MEQAMAGIPAECVFKKPKLVKRKESSLETTPENEKEGEGVFFYFKEVTSPATNHFPSLEDYPGPFEFSIELGYKLRQSTNLQFSSLLNKLFIADRYCLPMKFNVKLPPKNLDGLYVRAVVLYVGIDSLSKPVLRCPTHMHNDKDPYKEYFDHVIISCNPAAVFEVDNNTQRRSVSVPLVIGQWEPYVFSCRNSCSNGMNRRPTAIVFTLEKLYKVYGRVVLNLKVCSVPQRDKEYEEKKEMNNGSSSSSRKPIARSLFTVTRKTEKCSTVTRETELYVGVKTRETEILKTVECTTETSVQHPGTSSAVVASSSPAIPSDHNALVHNLLKDPFEDTPQDLPFKDIPREIEQDGETQQVHDENSSCLRNLLTRPISKSSNKPNF